MDKYLLHCKFDRKIFMENIFMGNKVTYLSEQFDTNSSFQILWEISFGEFNIGFLSECGRAVQVKSQKSLSEFQVRRLPLPKAERGLLILENQSRERYGNRPFYQFSHQKEEKNQRNISGEFCYYYDPNTRWACILSRELEEPVDWPNGIQFMRNAVLLFGNSNEIHSLWIRIEKELDHETATLELVHRMPQFKEKVKEEVEFMGGYECSHVILASVLNPHLRVLLNKKWEQSSLEYEELKTIFDYLDWLAGSNDYFENLVTVSILEVLTDEEVWIKNMAEFMSDRLKMSLKEIYEYLYLKPLELEGYKTVSM